MTIKSLHCILLVAALILHSQAEVLLSQESNDNDVTLKTFKVIKDSSKGSLIVSPFSLRIMMAMLQAGSRGNTQAQINSAMEFPLSEEELFESYREQIQWINNPSPIKTEIANRIFIKDGFLIQENFQNILKHYFQAPLQQLSFEKPKKAAEEINDYVARKTNQRIQRIVEASDITNQTRMLLINSLYFKGAWENPFPTLSTRKMQFFLDDNGRSTTVDMMRVETYFKAADFRDLDCKGIVIPYEKVKGKDEGYQMVILLPNQKTGLANLERNLKNFSILEKLYNVKARNIELRLPRFKLESRLDLKQPLQTMGVTDVFDENVADLGGIPTLSKATSKIQKKDEDKQLHVSKFIQKAFLSVDEAGSEAGAATLSVVFVPLSIGPAVDEVITVDRPFFGFIRDARTKTILFTFRKTE